MKTIAAFDEVIRELQEKGIAADELDPVKVKFRSDYYSMLEGGMGSYMPRFGLMHYLACFTLFDGDPNRVNTILDGFLAVTPAQVQAAARKYLVPQNRAIVVRKPVAKWSCPMTTAGTPAIPTPQRSSAPALGAERPVAWPKRTVRTLSNGMQVVLAESRTFPKISAQLFFRSGNAAVAHRAPGLAEMTATVVRTGTASRPSRQIEEDLRRMGADLGTHAGADSSAISVSGLAEFSDGLSRLDCRSRAQRFVSRRRIRARAPPANRRTCASSAPLPAFSRASASAASFSASIPTPSSRPPRSRSPHTRATSSSEFTARTTRPQTHS